MSQFQRRFKQNAAINNVPGQDSAIIQPKNDIADIPPPMSTPEAVATYFKDLILGPRSRANTDASVCLELRSPLFDSIRDLEFPSTNGGFACTIDWPGKAQLVWVDASFKICYNRIWDSEIGTGPSREMTVHFDGSFPSIAVTVGFERLHVQPFQMYLRHGRNRLDIEVRLDPSEFTSWKLIDIRFRPAV